MSNYSNNNPYDNNPYQSQNNNPNYTSNNRPPINRSLVKSLKGAAIAYIVFFFLSFIFVIVAFIVSIQNTMNVINDPYSYTSAVNNIATTYLAMMILAIIISISTFIICIVLIVKANKMKIYSNDFDTIFILTIVGLFIPFLTLISSFMILSKTKRI